jgi:hypothetical protein
LIEDAAVLIEEEVFRAEIFDGGVKGVVVEENGAQDGTLGVEVVGEGLFESGIDGHSVRFSFAYSNTSPLATQGEVRAQVAFKFSGLKSLWV